MADGNERYTASLIVSDRARMDGAVRAASVGRRNELVTDALTPRSTRWIDRRSDAQINLEPREICGETWLYGVTIHADQIRRPLWRSELNRRTLSY